MIFTQGGSTACPGKESQGTQCPSVGDRYVNYASVIPWKTAVIKKNELINMNGHRRMFMIYACIKFFFLSFRTICIFVIYCWVTNHPKTGSLRCLCSTGSLAGLELPKWALVLRGLSPRGLYSFCSLAWASLQHGSWIPRVGIVRGQALKCKPLLRPCLHHAC